MTLTPRRSVTRFFIPLIDVLILLFCIFLLMPFVSAPTPTQDEKAETKPPAPELPADVKELQKQLAAALWDRDEAVKRLDQFQKDRGDKLAVRVLEIDPENGKLYYYAPGRTELASQAQAEQLILAEKGRLKDVYFLILYPRKASRYPIQADLDRYRAWFRNVPYGFDIPRGGP